MFSMLLRMEAVADALGRRDKALPSMVSSATSPVGSLKVTSQGSAAVPLPLTTTSPMPVNASRAFSISATVAS